MNCCPLFGGKLGHVPYLLIAFFAFCVVAMLIIISKLNALLKSSKK